jgi:hypothetical protein
MSVSRKAGGRKAQPRLSVWRVASCALEAVKSGGLGSLIRKPPKAEDSFPSKIALSLDAAIILPRFSAMSSAMCLRRALHCGGMAA